MKEQNFIDCSKCKYSELCPCEWSLHNTTCLIIQKSKEKLNKEDQYKIIIDEDYLINLAKQDRPITRQELGIQENPRKDGLQILREP